jgi:hypothetical protein
MSYSISNVLKETGINNIMRWIPFEVDANYIIDELRNKMIRPTTIPHTLKDLVIEHAVAREALRLGFIHHKSLARPLRGGSRADLDIAQRVTVVTMYETYIDMLHVEALGGTGGLLSHAPRRVQSALMLIDGFRVEGITKLFQDSVFMMPHLGVLSTVHSDAALNIFDKDCLVRLGTVIAFRGTSNKGDKVADVQITMPNGEEINETIVYGTIQKIPLAEREKAQVNIDPTRRFDIGTGPGHKVETQIEGGVVGIIIDARGRPLDEALPDNGKAQRQILIEWLEQLEAYPREAIESWK